MRRQEKTRNQKTRRGSSEANFDGGIPDRKEHVFAEESGIVRDIACNIKYDIVLQYILVRYHNR